MRARSAVLLALLLALISAFSVPSVAFAQDQPDEQSEEGGDAEGEEGAGEAEAETGAGEGETGGATEEEGPPWTYQMARITLALLILLFLAMGLLYWRLLASRQRAGA